MDKKAEKSNKDKVLRRLANILKKHDFIRTKPSFFVRERGPLIEFIHIHKFSFGPSFRLHVCLRVINDPRDWVALLGFDSDLYCRPNSPNGKKYNFSYHVKNETIERCVVNIHEFINEVAEPWYEKWRNPVTHFSDPGSPFGPEDIEALKLAISGGEIEDNSKQSRILLGLA